MKSDHTEGGLLSNLELTKNRLLLDQTLHLMKKSSRLLLNWIQMEKRILN